MHATDSLDGNVRTNITAPAPVPAPTRLVTDAPTRMFHALFALSFAGAFITADSESWRLVHVTLGYLFAGLLGFRVLYGLFGPRHARLGLLARRLASAPAWLRSSMQADSWRDIKWRQGQNLAVAAAIVLMLALVIPLALSGHATYMEWGNAFGGEEWAEELHEFLANTFLSIVLAHVALIAALSVIRRQNQALPMLTGRIAGEGASPVKDNRTWLAILLLLAVFVSANWLWQNVPQGDGIDPDNRHALQMGSAGPGLRGDDD